MPYDSILQYGWAFMQAIFVHESFKIDKTEFRTNFKIKFCLFRRRKTPADLCKRLV